MPARKSSKSPAFPRDHPIQAVVGTDTAKVTALAREAAARLAPEDAGDFGVDTIDGAVDYVDEAVTRIHEATDALNTVSFFGGGKLVWLKNASFLADNVTGRSEKVQEALAALADTLEGPPPDGVRFLLSASQVDKRKSFYKRLDRCARVEVHDAVDFSRAGAEALAGLLTREARQRGFRFDPDALDLFMALCATDSTQIASELDKLRIYLGDESDEVTVGDIRALVSQTRAGVIWEIGNAFSARDLHGCLRAVGEFLARGESAIGLLLASLAPTIRNLLHAKVLIAEHGLGTPRDPRAFQNQLASLPEDALSHLPRKKDGTINTYPLSLAAVNSGGFSLAELEDALHGAARANRELVTTQLDPNVILTKLVTRALKKGSVSNS